MANKKGEGVRGVLGDLVSREKERRERPPEPAQSTASIPAAEERNPERKDALQGRKEEPTETTRDDATPPKKVEGIKGRPRGRKDEDHPSRGERTKVTLSIDEVLRDRFYRLAHGEMIQPGEYVERALRYYIENHPK